MASACRPRGGCDAVGSLRGPNLSRSRLIVAPGASPAAVDRSWPASVVSGLSADALHPRSCPPAGGPSPRTGRARGVPSLQHPGPRSGSRGPTRSSHSRIVTDAAQARAPRAATAPRITPSPTPPGSVDLRRFSALPETAVRQLSGEPSVASRPSAEAGGILRIGAQRRCGQVPRRSAQRTPQGLPCGSRARSARLTMAPLVCPTDSVVSNPMNISVHCCRACASPFDREPLHLDSRGGRTLPISCGRAEVTGPSTQ
jgi:hypothetical protein